MRMRLRRASGFAVTLGLLTATIALAPLTFKAWSISRAVYR